MSISQIINKMTLMKKQKVTSISRKKENKIVVVMIEVKVIRVVMVVVEKVSKERKVLIKN